MKVNQNRTPRESAQVCVLQCVLQSNAVCVAVCCRVLQCVAVCCSAAHMKVNENRTPREVEPFW